MTALRQGSGRPSVGVDLADFWVTRVQPAPGERFVLADTPVLLRLSHPAEAASVSPRSVRVLDPAGPVPCEVRLSADGCVVIWRAARLLVPGVVHHVRAAGLQDVYGRRLLDHESAFVPCGLVLSDLTVL